MIGPPLTRYSLHTLTVDTFARRVHSKSTRALSHASGVDAVEKNCSLPSVPV